MKLGKDNKFLSQSESVSVSSPYETDSKRKTFVRPFNMSKNTLKFSQYLTTVVGTDLNFTPHKTAKSHRRKVSDSIK